MWTPNLYAPATEYERENIRKLIDDSSFGIWNAFSGGAPGAIYNKTNLGTWIGLLESAGVGFSSFTNILTLGFQNSIRDAIWQTQEEMLDLTFEKGYNPNDIFSAIWINLGSIPKGVVLGSINNVYNWLPFNEAETLGSASSSSAEKWGAAFSGISKIANLAALGAGLRQNATYFGPNKSEFTIEVGTAKAKNSINPFNYHSSIFFPKTRMLAERVGGGTYFEKQLSRPSAFGEGEAWEEKYFDWRNINLSKKQFNQAQSFSRKSIVSEKFRFTKNCSMFANDLLQNINIPNILSSSRFAPELLKANLDNMNYLVELTSGSVNSAIQQTEKKNKVRFRTVMVIKSKIIISSFFHYAYHFQSCQ